MWAGAEVMACHLLRQLHSNLKLYVSAIVLNYGRLVSELLDFGIQIDLIHENHNYLLRIAIQIRNKFWVMTRTADSKSARIKSWQGLISTQIVQKFQRQIQAILEALFL